MLLQIEAQEAVHEVARSVISGVIAAVLVLGGWLLVVPALLWMLCKQQGWPFENVFIIAGIFHLLSAIVFLKRMLNRLARARWFAETLDQFKHDRAWLAQQTRNP